MPKSIKDLFNEGKDWRDVGNVAKRRALRAMYQQNYAQQVREATALNPSGLPENLPSQYTVTNNDTLSTIANANGTTEADLLKANPDVKRLQAGMVINTPRPQNYLDSERTYKPNFAAYNQSERTYGIDKPNNQFGGVGNTSYGPPKPPGGIGVPSAGPIGGVQGGLTTTGFGTQSAPSIYQPAVNAGSITGNVTPNFNAAIQNLVNRTGTPTAAPQPAVSPFVSKNPTVRTKDDYLPTQLAALANLNTYTPSPWQLAYMEKYGMIRKAGAPANGGANSLYNKYKPKGRGGGGGGGRVRPTLGSQQGDRMPAFSTGGGFNGLVNWRI